MATPPAPAADTTNAAVPTGFLAPEGAPVVPEPTGAPAVAPDPQGLPTELPDGVTISGRGGGQPPATPQTPAAEPASPSQAQQPETTPPAGEPAGATDANGKRQEVSDLPDWAQTLIKDTRSEMARTRVDAKNAAAEEATKKVTEDIGRALGLITDDTPEEEKLTPEQLKDLLSGERSNTQAVRTELAVFKAASSDGINAAALLDSRSFLDAVKDVDPTDTEKLKAAIQEAVNANPWLKPEPTPDPAAAAGQPGATSTQAPATIVPPSGGSFAGGPGAQPQDLSSMSVDDFRKLRQNAPRP